jgi:argininosuccinate synthase
LKALHTRPAPFARQLRIITVVTLSDPTFGKSPYFGILTVARDTVILAYSGGLDTSVAVKWINEQYNLDVIAYTCDLGQGQDIASIRQKALRTGAVAAVAEDVRNLFVDYFAFPSLMAGALYEGKYPLATALGRPLIAQRMVHFAREHNAKAVAHGCTGKGNDQVRFDVTFQTLAPDLKIIAPVREWKWTRSEEIAYAHQHGIALEAASEKIFSVDQNIWGRSVESGVLEDPWVEPPADAFEWTTDPRRAPDEPDEVTITFERGRPVGLDGREVDGVPLIEELNRRAGAAGVGRIDHVENRLVGIKSRELYEAPAATVLHLAHRELESLTLSKEAARFKTFVSQAYSDLIYNGLWFSALHQDLMAFVVSNQQYVTGSVRVKMFKGQCSVTGRKSEYSLYRHELATYEKGDQYDASAAQGFIKIHGLMQTTQAKQQMLKGPGGAGRLELPSIIPPSVTGG